MVSLHVDHELVFFRTGSRFLGTLDTNFGQLALDRRQVLVLWRTLGYFGDIWGIFFGDLWAMPCRIRECLLKSASCALQPGLASFSKLRRSSAMRELPQSFHFEVVP